VIDAAEKTGRTSDQARQIARAGGEDFLHTDAVPSDPINFIDSSANSSLKAPD
jgi:hypothetical protein